MKENKRHNCKMVPEFECQGQSVCEYKTDHKEDPEWCGENFEGYCLSREVQYMTLIDFMRVNVKSAEKNGVEL